MAKHILKDNMNLELIPKYQKKKIIDEAQKKQTNSEMELGLWSLVSLVQFVTDQQRCDQCCVSYSAEIK